MVEMREEGVEMVEEEIMMIIIDQEEEDLLLPLLSLLLNYKIKPLT